jgi:hypothetical protein
MWYQIHTKKLDERLQNHVEEPTSGKNWNEINSKLSEKYGL